jgi:glutamate-1-semialdehyde aminotransferase
VSAGPLRLTAAEEATARQLCRDDVALWDVVHRVAAHQPGSVRWNLRAEASASGLPSQLPYSSPLLPLCVVRADGPRITDVDGHEYVDCHMAYTAGVLGHRPAPVVEAVRAALDLGLGAGHFVAAQVELAEQVKAMVPGTERVALFHAGGDAVAAAVSMARAATGRPLVAKLEGCYHGWHEIGLCNPLPALSGRLPSGPLDAIPPEPATAGLPPAAGSDVVVLPFNSPVAFDVVRRRTADLACVVADPIPPFMAGWPDDAAAFVAGLRAVTAECQVPLVLDEVVSGFRLARGGAQESFGVAAEMAAFGKVTSGLGLALSAVAGQGRFLDTARSGGVGADYAAGRAWVTNTHTAAYPAVAAALAQLRFLDEHHEVVTARLDRSHALLGEAVAAIAAETGIAVRLDGHPRLQSMVAFGEAPAGPGERNLRAVVARSTPAQRRALQALPLYLRLEGVYTKSLPTMNLSAAHRDADVELVAGALRRSLLRMAGDGVVPA